VARTGKRRAGPAPAARSTHHVSAGLPPDDVFFGHVLGFKGLERPAVVLAVNGFGRGAERAKEKLYVGLSRARDLLVVCGDPGVIKEVGGEGVLRRLAAGRV
jgi:hypothetical protein